MNMTLSACHVRTAMIGIGCYLLGAGELAITDLETLLGAAFPLVAGAWKYVEAKRAAAPAGDHGHA